jgi:OmpA-OmpF porin, OOP family
MKLSRLLPVIAGGFLLSACATPWQVAEVQDAKTITATGGTAFTKALTEEYKTQARIEAEVENEWPHAVLFARKASRAAGGETFTPDDLSGWDLSAEATKALTYSRGLLMADFATGARERVPALAATAQANFDCWVEEESEGDSHSSCKEIFLQTEPQLKAPAPAPVAKIEPKTFIVYFAFNKAGLTADAKKVIDDVVAANSSFHPVRIVLTGHTDTVGAKGFNQKLSEKRTKAVADALAKRGIQTSVLSASSYGKDKPVVRTVDNVREAKNRRVEVILEK